MAFCFWRSVDNGPSVGKGPLLLIFLEISLLAMCACASALANCLHWYWWTEDDESARAGRLAVLLGRSG